MNLIECIYSRVKKRPIFAFYLLSFLLTWLFWVPQVLYSYGMFPFDSPVLYVLGGVGPLAAALIVARPLYGNKDGEEVFKPLFHWRVGKVWYIIAAFGGIIIMLASMGVRGEFTLGLGRLSPNLSLLIGFVTYLIAAIPEEIAWRGFALPRLQTRYNALTASLIVGVLWALWHLPLLFIRGNTMASYSLLPFLIEVIADSVIYTWLYNGSRGSAPIVIIFHAVTNVVGPNAGIEQSVIIVFIAAVIVFVCGPSNLSRNGDRVAYDSGTGSSL